MIYVRTPEGKEYRVRALKTQSPDRYGDIWNGIIKIPKGRFPVLNLSHDPPVVNMCWSDFPGGYQTDGSIKMFHPFN